MPFIQNTARASFSENPCMIAKDSFVIEKILVRYIHTHTHTHTYIYIYIYIHTHTHTHALYINGFFLRWIIIPAIC